MHQLLGFPKDGLIDGKFLCLLHYESKLASSAAGAPCLDDTALFCDNGRPVTDDLVAALINALVCILGNLTGSCGDNLVNGIVCELSGVLNGLLGGLSVVLKLLLQTLLGGLLGGVNSLARAAFGEECDLGSLILQGSAIPLHTEYRHFGITLSAREDYLTEHREGLRKSSVTREANSKLQYYTRLRYMDGDRTDATFVCCEGAWDANDISWQKSVTVKGTRWCRDWDGVRALIEQNAKHGVRTLLMMHRHRGTPEGCLGAVPKHYRFWYAAKWMVFGHFDACVASATSFPSHRENICNCGVSARFGKSGTAITSTGVNRSERRDY
ncbi:hypothetical protein HPB47_016850 [Ixodes persulcatus]|uniref:Uncharacterized protein n=1 Tax=Ixodes persulcatus TaxID=34615 RepID=A0AC60QPU2_IXOPE|nr:hypothetical protein HPB47_016850 [Ixodes persulcatus]